MIRAISSIREFGIFKDYSSSGVSPFGRFNLIYGWNGSGKSTLALLFESLERRRLPHVSRASNPVFSVALEGGHAVTNANIDSCTLEIRVFNESFVRENIDWNSSVKSILLVAKETIDDRKRLDDLTVAFERKSNSLASEKEQLIKLQDEIGRFFSDAARRIKQSFQVIGTKDSRYFNYNKSKLEELFGDEATAARADTALISDAEVVRETESAKPTQKQEVSVSLPALEKTVFQRAHERLLDLLGQSVANRAIDRLTKNPDIEHWVAQGLQLHEHHHSSDCEYCGRPLSADRIRDLSDHFNEEFKQFKERLSRAAGWVAEHKIQIPQLGAERLYEELQTEFQTFESAARLAAERINSQIDQWKNLLERKIENPFDNSLIPLAIVPGDLESLVEAVARIADLVNRHNEKTRHFEAATGQSKRRLELHYAASEARDFSYFSKSSEIKSRKALVSALESEVSALRIEIRGIEARLSNEALGAGEFNESLHRFLGRTELSLRFNPTLMGYEIVRNDSGAHDQNLSEGERNAIALVYFITKLVEKGTKLSNTVVVIDDPASSFDSNHLFAAYSFIRTKCDQSKQLFVLTHNFTFYKLMRDWFAGVNRNLSGRKPPQPHAAYFYCIEASQTSPRRASLKDASKSLVEFNSEYHYLFEKLWSFREQKNLSRDEAFMASNAARRLLEAFFSFKYPRQRSDIAQLLDAGLGGCTKTTKDTKERIYRFVNQYSHSNVIEADQSASDNLTAEGPIVVQAIFDWLREVDSVHFEEMTKAVAQ